MTEPTTATTSSDSPAPDTGTAITSPPNTTTTTTTETPAESPPPSNNADTSTDADVITEVLRNEEIREEGEGHADHPPPNAAEAYEHEQKHAHGIMAVFKMKKSSRLLVIIGISFAFFVAEISVGFYTSSLALVADAFHYLNDLISFVVALVALKISERRDSPNSLSFGWQRSNLLGAFFNGVFMVALGVSIFLQALERFIQLKEVENPKLVLIVGCVGLTLNIISALFLHDHDHDHGTHAESASDSAIYADVHAALHRSHRHALPSSPTTEKHSLTEPHSHSHSHGGHGHSHADLGMSGVLLHVIGDALNNIGVIIAALVIWKATYPGRYYADPAVSLAISLMILLGSIPLVKSSGSILMQSLPQGVKLDDIRHDMESAEGVVSVHELHVWLLDQTKAIASAHVVMGEDKTLQDFIRAAECIGQCLHAYGIHSVTLQPELPGGVSRASTVGDEGVVIEDGTLRMRNVKGEGRCNINCGTSCETLTCCGNNWKDD